MAARNVLSQYPLSPLQEGMLFHYLREPGAGIDIEQIVCTLPEPVQAEVLKTAWQRVISRHSVLRTEFRWQEQTEPYQMVYEAVDLPWQELDWSGCNGNEHDDKLKAFLAADRSFGFDMSCAPLLRVTLIKLAEDQWQMIWTFHHALIDGRSFPALLNEVFAIFEALSVGQEANLPRPKHEYREYAEWSRRPSERIAAEKFWRNQLQGFTTPTPVDVNESRFLGKREGRQGDDRIVLDRGTTAALTSYATENAVTLNTLVQSAWALLLSRYSGENDVLFGVVRACRKSSIPGADDIVGLFINTLPLRVSVPNEARVTDWLKDVRSHWMSMRDYEHTPLAQVQRWSEVPVGTQLFNSILMFESYELETRLRQQGGNWVNRSVRLYEQTGYPITLTVYSGTELCLQIEFDRRQFGDPTIRRMLNHLKTILVGMLGPSKQVGELPMLTADEQRQLLIEWNDTERHYPKTALLHELFDEQVRRTPTKKAVTFEGEDLTYDELRTRANQVAHYLQKQGVKPDSLVAICMHRSLDLVIALYGVLKAGAAYVPLDPEYPPQRLQFMLTDAAAPVLLTHTRLLPSIPTHAGLTICLDRDWNSISSEPTVTPVASVKPDNLAYMIYTSGSTGQPKGAMNTHRGICNRLLWMQEQYRLTAADKILQKTPYSFDVSVWEFFWPLLAGAEMVVARPGGHRDPTYLVNVINQESITVTHFVPSMLRIFVEEPGVETCKSLRHVICSGEALGFDLQQTFFKCSSAQLHNLYGPTEAAVDVSHWTCRRDEERQLVPIGRPVANTELYILDRLLHPVPIGVPGELYIGGIQVGRGYHNRPDLTADRFIADPFRSEPEARLYKTGDLCRWLPDGVIEYIGRLDFQVKIRGLRVELGEIEAAIKATQLVKACAVLAHDNDGEKQIIAYVVWQAGMMHSADALREYLRNTLPEYMLPAYFIRLSELPLTPNGKLDKRALPSITADPIELNSTRVPPRSEVEQQIAEVWAHALGHKNMGCDDNFFDLGGDSLRMMRVRNELQRCFNRELPIVEMFRCTTIRKLAEHIAAQPSGPKLREPEDRFASRKAAVRRSLEARQQARA